MSKVAKDPWDFLEAPVKQTLADFKETSVGWLIQRRIEEAAQPGRKKQGASHGYTLKRLQKAPIGGKAFAKLKAMDFINHCEMRRGAGIKPQTIMQDMTYLSGVLKHAFEIWEIPEAEDAWKAYRKAKPQLMKEQLIAKSQPRERRPTLEELERLYAYFEEQGKHKNTRLPMRAIAEFQVHSGRRISETCRLLWSDLDTEKRICLVRDLKNPKGKGFHDSFPLLGRAWDIVMAQPRTSDRIFPHNAKSCGASYTRAKKILGIKGLRMHDSRRECISRLFEAGYNVPEVARVSLHRNPTQLLGTYTRLKAEDLHKGPAAKRAAQ